MEANNIQKVGGWCAVFEALIYIAAFVVYGGILVYPASDATTIERIAFLSDNYLILSILNVVSYVLFGVLLVGLVLAVHQRLKAFSPFSKLAFAFGIIWSGLVIASGMISNIGLTSVIEMAVQEPDRAYLVYKSISIVTEGLGGGNEIVGGIWVLSLSMIALKAEAFTKPLSYLGVLVGLCGVLTIYPLDVFAELFGLSQIVWFLWIGIFMIRKPLTQPTS